MVVVFCTEGVTGMLSFFRFLIYSWLFWRSLFYESLVDLTFLRENYLNIKCNFGFMARFLFSAKRKEKMSFFRISRTHFSFISHTSHLVH